MLSALNYLFSLFDSIWASSRLWVIRQYKPAKRILWLIYTFKAVNLPVKGFGIARNKNYLHSTIFAWSTLRLELPSVSTRNMPNLKLLIGHFIFENVFIVLNVLEKNYFSHLNQPIDPSKSLLWISTNHSDFIIIVGSFPS